MAQAGDAWSAAIDSETPRTGVRGLLRETRRAAEAAIPGAGGPPCATPLHFGCGRVGEGHGRRGQALVAMRRFAEASVAFAKAGNLDPANREYLQPRGKPTRRRSKPSLRRLVATTTNQQQREGGGRRIL